MEAILFPDATEHTIAYLRSLGYKVSIQPRPTTAEGLHISLTDPGGSQVQEYVLEEHILILDVSHPDSVEASRHARRIVAVLRAWAQVDPDVLADPRTACSAPVWNPLDEPRVPAYTLTARFFLRGDAVEVSPVLP